MHVSFGPHKIVAPTHQDLSFGFILKKRCRKLFVIFSLFHLVSSFCSRLGACDMTHSVNSFLLSLQLQLRFL